MTKWIPVLLILRAASAWPQAAHPRELAPGIVQPESGSGTLCGARPAVCAVESAEMKRLNHTSETDRQIQNLQDRVRVAPDDYAGYDNLGSAFLQKARDTGDITYYDLAEQTLRKALDLAPQDFRAADPLVHMALVYMGEHRFQDALAEAQKAIGTGSGNLVAFAVEGDAYTDMGDYDEAAAAYDAVWALGREIASPSTLAYMSDSRIAYLPALPAPGDSGG